MTEYDNMLNLTIILSIKDNDVNKLVKEINAIKNSKSNLDIEILKEYILRNQNDIFYKYLNTNNFEGIEIFHYLKDEKLIDINKIKIQDINWQCENLISYFKDIKIFNNDTLNELINSKNYEKIYTKKFELLIDNFEINYNKVSPENLSYFINEYIDSINMSEQLNSGMSKRNEYIEKIRNKILNHIPNDYASEIINLLNDNEIKSFLTFNNLENITKSQKQTNKFKL